VGPAWALHETTFSEWLPSCLKAQDVKVCSRNSAPDGPAWEPMN